MTLDQLAWFCQGCAAFAWYLAENPPDPSYAPYRKAYAAVGMFLLADGVAAKTMWALQ